MFKKGDLVRFKDGVNRGTWGFKDQVAIVLCNDYDDSTRVMVLAWREGNHKKASDPDRGIGVYTNRLEKL